MKKFICVLMAAAFLFISGCSVINAGSKRVKLPTVPYVLDDPVVVSNDMTVGLCEGESLYSQALLQLMPCSVIFSLAESSVYCLGNKIEAQSSVVCNSEQDLFYIPFTSLATVFGGKTEGKNILYLNGCRVECDGTQASYTDLFLKQTTRKSIDFSENEQGYCIEAASVAEICGLNMYATDSGIIVFSNGKILDETKGFYIAEQAHTLFDESFDTSNMFVDLPSVYTNGKSAVTAYSYAPLDLHAEVSAYRSQGVTTSVTLAPSIVAGEGENDDNGTVVRVFDEYQTLHTQFSAYSPSVKGGVFVAVGKTNVLTAPCKDTSVTSLKVYDVNGCYKFSIDAQGDAPYTIAAGDFLETGSLCFAVMSRNGEKDRKIELFSADSGEKLTQITAALQSGNATLCAEHIQDGCDNFIANFTENGSAYRLSCQKNLDTYTGAQNTNGFYRSAFGDIYITTNDEAYSYVNTTDGKKLDIGERENLVFSSLAENRTDTFLRYGIFLHRRTDWAVSPVLNIATNPADMHSCNFSLWDASSIVEDTSVTKTYSMQEPCFTHRWFQNNEGNALRSIINKKTNLPAYAALTSRNKTTTEAEGFIVGSYAPYIQPLDRMRIWTLRSYLQTLAPLYRNAPEYTIAVSPVHEQEISVSDGVGDYNPAMIRGFCEYMLSRYGSIENINEVFGTPFTSVEDFDPPRGSGRGRWDRCYFYGSNGKTYYDEWMNYIRSMVSRRILEAYREALLAGIPPELIKAHQIPENNSVPSFLNNGIRVTPTDVVLSCGTAYGGTRYGFWMNDSDNFIALAKNSGHNNITLGEYSETSQSYENKYAQYKYMFENGVMMINYIPVGGEECTKVETQATLDIQAENTPRTASSGGVGAVHSYINGETVYDIAQIGAKADSPGLLKSIDANGDFEGSVYLQPFHAKVIALNLNKTENSGSLSFEVGGRTDSDGGALDGIRCSDAVDVRINASAISENASLKFEVYHSGGVLENTTATIEVDKNGEYRFYFANQMNLTDVKIVVSATNAEISDGTATLLYERSARAYYKETKAQPFVGGVNFDIVQK